MLSEITCSQCKDVVAISASSVLLPYVCGDCKDAKEFQANIAPAGVAAAAAASASGLDHGTATVENTTLLIQDLEQQLAETKKYANELEDTLQKSSELLDKSTHLIVDLSQQLKAEQGFANQIADDVSRVERKATAWEKSYYQAISRIAHLNRWIESLKENAAIRNRWNRNLQREVNFYQTRGFWARLVNDQYDSDPQPVR